MWKFAFLPTIRIRLMDYIPTEMCMIHNTGKKLDFHLCRGKLAFTKKPITGFKC